MTQYTDGSVSAEVDEFSVYGVWQTTITGTSGTFAANDVIDFSATQASGVVQSWSNPNLTFKVTSTDQPAAGELVSSAAATGTLYSIESEPAFISNIAVGDVFIAATNTPAPYYVASIPTRSKFNLTAPYGGPSVSGSNYSVTGNFTPHYSIPYAESGDQSPASVIKAGLVRVDQILLTLSGSIATLEAFH